MLRTADLAGTNYSSNKLAGDAFLPVDIESTNLVSYYKWEYREDVGLGFFKVDQATIDPHEPYLSTSSILERKKDAYLIGATAVGIETITSDKPVYEIFSIDGRRIQTDNPATLTPGIYIINGDKHVIR